MTTNSYDTPLLHTTNADFRAWGSALHAALVAAGITNTAEAGQIDFTSVTIPGAGVSGGYKIYAFNDTLQATAPIFLRLDFGTGVFGQPQVWAQIGTGTDGAGNLTGTVSTALAPIGFSDAIASTVTPYVTYVCYSAAVGYLGIAWKLGSCGLGNPGRGFLQVGRSCNSSGAPTATGATIYTVDEATPTEPAYAQSLRFTATAAAYAKHKNYAVVVGDVIGSLVGPNVQDYLNWAHYPRVEPINWVVSLITDEFPRGTSFISTLVGATPHTYLGLGEASPRASRGANTTHYSFGMLFE